MAVNASFRLNSIKILSSEHLGKMSFVDILALRNLVTKKYTAIFFFAVS